MTGLMFNNWTEAPREVLEATGFFLLGLITAHVKFARPARKRHQELLEHHKSHDERLKAIQEKAE